MSKLPVYRVEFDDGDIVETAMAKDVTLQQARDYYIGQDFVLEDETTTHKGVRVGYVTRNTLPVNALLKLREMGFRVYMRDIGSSYAVVESEDGICYVEYDSFRGFKINTIHRPSRGTGTGYGMFTDLPNLGADKIHSAIRTSSPPWEYSGASASKYKSMAEYQTTNKWNAGYVEVLP